MDVSLHVLTKRSEPPSACVPFLEELVASDLSPKTIEKHVDNLWALGGQIIRDLGKTCRSSQLSGCLVCAMFQSLQIARDGRPRDVEAELG